MKKTLTCRLGMAAAVILLAFALAPIATAQLAGDLQTPDSAGDVGEGIDSDGFPHINYHGGGALKYAQVSVCTLDAPVITACPGWGDVHIAVRGTDNGVWHNRRDFWSGNWDGWEHVQYGQYGYTLDTPALTCSPADDTAYIAVRGLDNGVWYNSQDIGTGDWTGWEHVQGGYTSNTPALAYTSTDDSVHLAVRGLDNGVWYNSRDLFGGDWAGWELVQSGYTYDSPTLTATRAGNVLIAVRGLDNGVWYNSRNVSTGNWFGWVDCGRSTKDSPALSNSCIHLPDDVQLAVQGMDDGVWYMMGAWGWGLVQNGYTYESPAFTYAYSRYHLVVRGTDNGVWYNHRPQGSWTWEGWELV